MDLQLKRRREYIDCSLLTYQFFCNIRAGDEFTFYNSDRKIRIDKYKPKESFTLEITTPKETTKLKITHMFGTWGNGWKSKQRKDKKVLLFNSIWRNVEGEIIMNQLNELNPLHEDTEIFKTALNERV